MVISKRKNKVKEYEYTKQPLYNSHPWDSIKVVAVYGEVKYIVNCTLETLKIDCYRVGVVVER